jgi:hypothetical protein
MRVLGVRDSFGSSDFANVLATLAKQSQDTNGDGGTRKPLTPTQLQLALSLVQSLSDSVLEAANLEIAVPDASGILAPAQELVYGDAPWLEEQGGSIPADFR